MNKEDYIITICFDKTGEAYWNVTKKGEPHMCNVEELKMVSSTFNLLRTRIDFITEEQWTDNGDNYCKMNCEGYKQTGKCFVDGRCKECLDNLKKMRKININNPEELKQFWMKFGLFSSYGFPFRLDDITEKGANNTIFCPIRWKSAFSPAKLRKLLREDVDDADKITVEYIDFVKEEVEDKENKVWNVDYF